MYSHHSLDVVDLAPDFGLNFGALVNSIAASAAALSMAVELMS